MNINDIIKKTYLHALTDGRFSETLSGVATAPFNATNLLTYSGNIPNIRQDYHSLQNFIFQPSPDRPEMKILEELSWSNTKITYKGTEYELPLFGQENYLLKTLYATSDEKHEYEMSDDTTFWKNGKLDTGIQLIFGYEIDPLVTEADKAVKPIDSSIIDNMDFMPDADVDVDRPFQFGERVKATERIQYTVKSLRVLVIIELIVKKPAADFEPSKSAVAVRLFPQTMVLANDRLDRIHTTTKLLRPSESFMKHDPMVSKIKSSFYADQNLSSPVFDGIDGYLWPNIFDYYKLKMEAFFQKGKKWTVVNPDLTYRDSPIKKVLQDDGRYIFQSLVKEPKQGAFDNIHIAPSMNAQSEVKTGSPIANLREMEEVAMAPVCQHDCFHLHWRWGKYLGLGNSSYFGWNDEFVPYQVPGAPMVPHNQRIDIELIDEAEEKNFGQGIAYHAIMTKDINPGQIQYVFHHGFGYVYEVQGIVPDIMLKLNTFWFYKHLKDEYKGASWGFLYYLIQNIIPLNDDNDSNVLFIKRLDTDFEQAANL